MLHSLNRDLVLGFFLCAVTLIAYLPALNGSPLWDDDANITSPALRSPEGLWRIWTHIGATQQYYPLVHTVWWVEYHLWGDSTTGNHLLNVLLHVFSALLLVRILRRLNVPGARLAAALFALHPVFVESVAWITELKNTLSGVFFLGATLTYLIWSETRNRRFYIGAAGLFILGLLSKTAIVPFPFAMLAVVWWKQGKLSWRRDVVPLAPFLLTGIAFGLVTSHVERTFVGAVKHDFSFSFIERFLIAGRAVWFYLGKIFWPADLIFIYPRWNVNAALWWQYLFPAAVVLAIAALWAVRGRWRAPLAVFLYFTAMLLPVLGFFNVYAFRFSFVADHWQYLAAIGPIAITAAGMTLGLGFLKEKMRRLLQPALYGILLSALGALTWTQSRMYADIEVLFQTTIQENPDCWMAHNNLGLLLAKSGRTDEAIAHYRKALEINPNYAKAHNNIGILLAKIGRTDEAMTHYRKALEINPDYAETHYNLGILLAKSGRTDEAIAHYRKALGINPNYANAHNNLGNRLAEIGRMDEAMAQYRRALEINPNYGEARSNLGNALLQTGRTDEAIACYRKALEIKPDNINVLNNLSTAFLQKGQLTDAIPLLQRALALAKSAGDESQARGIAGNLEKLYQASCLLQEKPR